LINKLKLTKNLVLVQPEKREPERKEGSSTILVLPLTFDRLNCGAAVFAMGAV
jgi:hypothetical protein